MNQTINLEELGIGAMTEPINQLPIRTTDIYHLSKQQEEMFRVNHSHLYYWLKSKLGQAYLEKQRSI